MAVGSFRLPNATSTTSSLEWVRPSDWLTMPTIGTQEFIGLLAITDDESNHIALTCQGAYTVDWGDGTTENVATNVKAQHTYTYSSISSSTLCSRGYKQVLVRVTPQSGQNLTKVDLQQQTTILGSKFVCAGWLEFSVNGANITTLTLGGNSLIRMGMVEKVVIGSLGTITSMANLFINMHVLQSVNLFNTAGVLNMSGMFASCYSIKTVPLYNMSSCTDANYMFYLAYSLRELPLFNLSSCTNLSGFVNECKSLNTLPLFNTAACSNFNSMAQLCFSLQSLPNFNTSAGTNFGTMLGNCNSLAKGAFQGTRYAISYSGNCLSQAAIVDIFNGLGTAVGAQTITVSNNPGTAGLTAAEKLIATAKGWTLAL